MSNELQGKDRIWQTLCKTMTASYTETKRNYPFPFVNEFRIPMQPFQTLVVHGLKKLELTIQPVHKIYQTLDAINIIPYLTFLQALWHLCEKKIEQKFCVYFDEYQLS